MTAEELEKVEDIEAGKEAVANRVTNPKEIKPCEVSNDDFDDVDEVLSRFRRNDIGNGQRLIHRFGKDIIFVHGKGWHVWDGKCWKYDEGDCEVLKLSHKTISKMKGEANANEYSAYDQYITGEINLTEYKQMVKSYKSFANSSGNSAQISAMIAQAAPYKAFIAENLDKNPYLLNVENGTVVFSRDGVKLKKHDRKDYMTRKAPVKYDADADCKGFRSFFRCYFAR